jgi:hypothetical protein
MKLNWRKIILIIVCSEFLFVYWNSLSTMSFKKQQTTHLVPTLQPQAPISKVKPEIKDNKIESELHIQEKAS